MTLTSTGGSSSVFKDGKPKPGVYKIQNIHSETYLDIELHSREVWCRPAKDLGEGRGRKWEIKQFGAGYTVQMVDPGNPEQFCTPLNGVNGGTTLRVAPYPVAWRVETVDNDEHRGFGYVRFYWGIGKITWDLPGAPRDRGAPVQTYDVELQYTWQMWRLVPVEVESTFTPVGSLPSYDGDVGKSSTRAEYTESEHDESGVVVNEVTVVTTTVTTHKRYRVENA